MKPNAYVAARLDTPVMNFIINKEGRKHSNKAGEVGIEIEVEGHNLLKAPSKWWQNIPDGSLRGESAEYVLIKPIKRGDVEEALNLLSNELVMAGSRIDDSYRTSVHVHLNCLKTPLRHLYNHMCLYLIVEDLLLQFCGEERVGNLFCLRAKDAEFLIQSLVQVLQDGRFNALALNDLRYAAMNVKALSDHGSLEFRAFRGTVNPVLIRQWVSILLEIQDAATKYNNPQEICKEVSAKGPVKFLEDIFSPGNLPVLLGQRDVDKKVLEGVRLVQDIAYALPTWDTVAEPEGPEYVPMLKARAGRPPRGAEFQMAVGRAVDPNAWAAVIRNNVIVDDMLDDDQPIPIHDDEDDF